MWFLVLILCLAARTYRAASYLPELNDSITNSFKDIKSIRSLKSTKTVTVSGISSGGYFAVQFHIAHSSLVSGAAIYAAGPYYCAKSSLGIAEMQCMNYLYGGPTVTELVSLTRDWSLLGYIDPVENLSGDHVYIFSGKLDTVIDQRVVKSLEQYYSAFTSRTLIHSEYSLQAEHCLPTLNYGEPCTALDSPYLGKCGYDGAGAGLNTLYDKLQSATTMLPLNLFMYDQTPYITRDASSIGDIGYLYIPSACQQAGSTCRLHVSFHGCEQNLALIGNTYAAHAGFNEWAEANNIVVLYPYVVQTKVPYNPNGCWDWWAYAGEDYGWKSGAQIEFVKNVIDALLGL